MREQEPSFLGNDKDKLRKRHIDFLRKKSFYSPLVPRSLMYKMYISKVRVIFVCLFFVWFHLLVFVCFALVFIIMFPLYLCYYFWFRCCCFCLMYVCCWLYLDLDLHVVRHRNVSEKTIQYGYILELATVKRF